MKMVKTISNSGNTLLGFYGLHELGEWLGYCYDEFENIVVYEEGIFEKNFCGDWSISKSGLQDFLNRLFPKSPFFDRCTYTVNSIFCTGEIYLEEIK